MVSAVINLPCQLVARSAVPENSTGKYNQPTAAELPRPPGQWRYKQGRKKQYCDFSNRTELFMANSTSFRSMGTVAMRWHGDRLELLDQRLLPGEEHWITSEGASGVAQCIARSEERRVGKGCR